MTRVHRTCRSFGLPILQSPIHGERAMSMWLQSMWMQSLVIGMLLWSFSAPTVVAEEPTPEQLAFFESKVRPILVEQCYGCHSAAAEKIEAGLVLDSKSGWEVGGDSGAAIVPGNLDESLLIQAVRYDEDVVSGMPPRSKLPAEQIEVLETWVEMGAPDPRLDAESGAARTIDAFDLNERAESHWSWKAITDPALPEIRDKAWPLKTMDRFVLAELERVGLKPALPADRRKWIRRVTFDLTGLPPSPSQISAFIEDRSPDAHQKVVDRLLDSQQFGEKWARHWLDLVRFAESYGHEFDFPIPGATEYRDYVIRAFNTDVPYDQFVREQIAGDLITEPRRNPEQQFNESILGTGFWFLHEATHAPTDVLGNEASIIDNQLDVFGKAFLGLTIACARCHDHKFDAISTEDYYALSSYLQSSCRQVIEMDVERKRELTAERIREQRRLAAQRLSAAMRDQPEQYASLLDPQLKSLASDQPAAAALDTGSVFADFNGAHLPDGWSTSGEAFEVVGPELTLRVDGTIPLAGSVDSSVSGAEQVGILRSPTFEISTKHIHMRMRATQNVTVHVVIDNYQMAPFSELLFAGTLLQGNANDTSGQWMWKSLNRDLQKYIGHRGYLEFIDAGNGSIAIDTIVFSDQPTPPADPPGDQREVILASLDPQTADLLAAAQQLSANLPPPRFALAMAQGTVEDARVYIRGSHLNLGNQVPPRFLEALGGEPCSRLELAERVASADNPLTARVAVNRLWHHLFGRGIVPTVDDFGPQGQPPSHPQLLDWLARDLIKSNWSLKHVIRKIVLSQTYRQDSTPHPDLDAELIAQLDPTNVWLHRMPVRRLPAESLRDAIFAVSGRLDLTPFGESVPTHLTPFMTGRGAKPSGPLDGNGRRSIYLAVYRNFLNPFLASFDTPSPFGPQGRRSQSNVPAQALTLLNDPMVGEQARFWATRVIADANPSTAEMIALKIAQMIESAHGTKPTVQQITAFESFLQQQSELYGACDERAWTDLAHALFNMKAFSFVE